MELFIALAVAIGLAILPFVILAGLVSLALLIWSWGRIGRYFVNFGRWLGDWRNFLPLSILGTIYILMLLLLMTTLMPQQKIVWLILLILHLIVTVVCINFAIIDWAIRLCRWFWPRYRRIVWSAVVSLWSVAPMQKPPKTGAKPPKKRSGIGSFWDLLLGKPTKATKAKNEPAEPQAESSVRPTGKSAKTSWFSRFWALMMGKPAKPAMSKSNPKPVTVQTTEQSLGPSKSMASNTKTASATRVAEPSPTPRANKKAAKGSWFSRFWVLMMGKPAKPRLQPAKVEPTEQFAAASATRSGISDPAATAMPVASTTAQVDKKTPSKTPLFSKFRALIIGRRARPAKPKARTTKAGQWSASSGEAKPTADVAASPPISGTGKKQETAKKGLFGRIWEKIVRGFTFVVGLIFLGVVWIVQKLREAVEWIRMKLNLD